MKFVLSLVVLTFALSVYGLGPFPIDKSEISVSGLSSGAFMAVQVHVAFSSKIMGAGVFAGGPYYCAQDQLTDAFTECMYGFGLDIQPLIQDTQQFASQGEIDNPNNLTKSNVYIYSGSGDTVVYPTVVKALQQYYQNWVSNIVAEYNIPSEHCLPTDDFGNECSDLGSPYINNCQYDGAGKALNTIYKNLKPAVTPNSNNIVSFSQDTYMPSGWTAGEASMSDTGYAYVPTHCQEQSSNKTCKLHFAFHGCQQTTADIGDDYYTDGGFNGWAEANNIVVIYPQIVKSDLFPENPEGCFDWWGYTNANYAVQSGPQVAFVGNLMEALTQ